MGTGRYVRLLVSACVVAVVATAVCGTAQAGLRSVWAVDDGEKIYQDDTDNPLENGEGNSVWDGSSVSLFAARNEIAAFQLIIEGDASGAQGVNVTVSDLTNGGSTISGSHPLPTPNDYVGVGVELFTEHYLNVTDPSGSPSGGYFNWSAAACPNLTGLMPDALVPFSAALGKGGAPFAVPADMNQGVWVDIYVDKGLPAGTYSGQVMVTIDGAAHSVIPLSLEVLDFELPDTNHYRSMVYFSDYCIRPRHNLSYSNQWPMLLEYHKMAHRHRLELIGNGSWDEITNLPGVLTGTAFTAAEGYEGPGEGVGNSLFSVSTYGGWWNQNQTYYETESDAWVNWFDANAPGVDYFLYLIDEPGPELYPDIQTRASWIHDNPGPGSRLPVFVSKWVTDALIGSVDIWGAPTQVYDTGIAATARTRGEDVYPYAAYRPKTTADVIDEWGIGWRLKPWIAHKCDVSRWFTWESTHWIGNSNELDPGGQKNVWANPKTFETTDESSCGNGDGTMFYPGRDYVFPAEDREYPGPISSYRMKMYRRGVQDVEYMWLAEQAGKAGDVGSILEDVLPHVMDDALTLPDWSNSNNVYEQGRYELMQLLQPSAPPSAKFQASPSRGGSPLTVAFTDLSINSPTSWSWDFGDGGTSTAQNPTHEYTGLGGYSVSLTVSNAYGSDTKVRNNCVTLVNEVIVYPDSWSTFTGWAGASVVSGTLDDVHNDDGAYWVTRSDSTQEQRYSLQYYADTSYTPTQVARITAEYQAKSSRSDNPQWTLAFLRRSDGGFQYMGNWLPSTTDTWFTLETTDISRYMDSNGAVGFELCGCPGGSEYYDISTDVMRFRLELAEGGPLAPAAAFTGTPTIGPAPLTVSFTDASANSPTVWSWDFGDGGSSAAQNPTHSFTTVGRYTVSLTVSNSRGNDTVTRTNYVTVASFSDVALTYWALAYIEACVKAGIVGGYDDGTYRPNAPVTRDQMAVYVSRALAGSDELVPTGPAVAQFSDVTDQHWAYKYVEYAFANGIVVGFDDGTYQPDWEVDRGQMAVYMARAIATPTGEAGVPDPPADPTFPDVTAENEWDWCYRHVEYIAAQGVTYGYDDGLYHPEYICTRDQMAVYVTRAFGLPM